MSELSPSGGSKRYGACDDAQMQTFVTAFATNQRDEVRDLHDVAGALSAQPGMKQQTFVAGCLTPWDTQQARVFTPDGTAPTLAGADGGGGRNPGGLVFDGEHGACLTPWDTQQARITAPEGVSPTINSGEAKPGGLVFAAGFCAGAGPSAGGNRLHRGAGPYAEGRTQRKYDALRPVSQRPGRQGHGVLGRNLWYAPGAGARTSAFSVREPRFI